MPVGSTSNAGKTGRGPIIEVKNLRKEYPVLDETVVALERVNLAIPQGQICCIYGESGSGKSTLLNQLAGMEKPTKGGVRITGVSISRLDERQLAEFRQKHLGFVFQSYNLLPNLNAIENVAMPLMFRGVPKRKRDSKTKTEVMDMICSFARDFNQTIVLVTHDDNMAQYADRIVTLLDGRIIGDRLT